MMKVNGTHVHAVFQVCCIGSILLLLFSISYIIYLINFVMYKNFLIISTIYNVILCGRIFVYDEWALEWILPN